MSDECLKCGATKNSPTIIDTQIKVERGLRRQLADSRSQTEVLLMKLSQAQARIAELEAALTPSAATKKAYSGEFSVYAPYFDDEGVEFDYFIDIPWDTIKKIMEAILEQAAQESTK